MRSGGGGGGARAPPPAPRAGARFRQEPDIEAHDPKAMHGDGW